MGTPFPQARPYRLAGREVRPGGSAADKVGDAANAFGDVIITHPGPEIRDGVAVVDRHNR
ncbi:MAG: hypothetical protein EBT14_06740 [Betaproteobacteria bacterium]|nr:hypothetical protein [Betaproteobacteria bacterium]